MTASEWSVLRHEHLWVVARDVEDDNGRGVTEHLCQDGKPVTFGSDRAAEAIVALLNRGTIAPLNQDRRSLRLEIKYRVEPDPGAPRLADQTQGFVDMLERLSFVESVEVVE